MQKTGIGWCDYTTNLLRYQDSDGNVVHACVRASEGCRNCYSQTLAGRWGRKGKEFTAENMKRLIPFLDMKEVRKLLRSRKVAGKKVFANDMTDWMGPWVSDRMIDMMLAVFALRPDVTFQTLTKHADRQRSYFAKLSPNGSVEAATQRLEQAAIEMGFTEETQCQIANSLNGVLGEGLNVGWPMRNLHLGVSVEDQKNADARIPHLLDTPAAVRWLSIEPLIADIELGDPAPHLDRHDIDGIVIGGESGPGYREMPLESALRTARYAQRAGISVFFKQDSGPRPGMQGRIPDDVWAMKEWPEAKAVTA